MPKSRVSNHMADNTDPYYHKSTLPEITLPEGGFKSTIPEHLLANETPATQWIMKELSKNSQATEFACQAAEVHNHHLRALNGKTYKNEKVAEEVRAELIALKEQNVVLTPVSKAFGSFTYLWENKAFKVIFILGIFVIAGVLYPWYVSAPGQTLLLAIKHWIES